MSKIRYSDFFSIENGELSFGEKREFRRYIEDDFDLEIDSAAIAILEELLSKISKITDITNSKIKIEIIVEAEE